MLNAYVVLLIRVSCCCEMYPEEGFHTFKYPDGSVYEGYWFAGKRHGHGVHEFPSGGQYSGEFRNGVRHGEGRYIYPGGDVYTGTFVAGYREGEGEYVYAHGGSYAGEWVCDRMHGFGKAKDSSGKVLIGMWIDGQAHGICRLEDGDTVRSVCYKNGTLVSESEPEQHAPKTKDPFSDGLNWLASAITNNLSCEALGCGTRSTEVRISKARSAHVVKASESPARGRASARLNDQDPRG